MAGADGDQPRDLTALVAGNERDFLVRSNGDQVKISDIAASTVGLYFSASWCPPCRKFTLKLIDTYNELFSQGKGFEVIFVSGDNDEEDFNGYFSKMPWLAIPFSDSQTRERLDELFEVTGIPHLVLLNAQSGDVLSNKGVHFVREYGSDAYPFTPEKISKLKEVEEAAKRAQTLQSVLSTPGRNYIISNKGDEVLVSELEGKIVGLLFYVSVLGPCAEFTSSVAKIYQKLKESGESFEVVAVSLDDDKSEFDESFSSMPWLAIPFEDHRERLARYFELRTLPTLVLIGSDGKTLNPNIAEVIEEHGMDAWEAFPFSTEKLDFLAEKARRKAEAQTLESLLISEELDYVIGKDSVKVPVSELVGKTILLYFSAQWCGPCRAFLPKLIEEYHKIKEKDGAFDIVFVSSDRDQNSYNDFFSGMPWLALPFEDERKTSLKRAFKIGGIPTLVAIGPTGRTVTKDAKELLMIHGADAYPFTEQRIKELEAKMEEMAKGWPEKIKHELHAEHELVLVRRKIYWCNGCDEMGHLWSFYCAECDFDLHPKCALKEEKGGDDHTEEAGQNGKEGYVCDGEVCRKVE